MCEKFDIESKVKLILITGNPGAWKSTVAKRLFCGLPEDWNLVSLDTLFYLNAGIQHGDNWATFAANAPLRAAVIKYTVDRRGKVIAEGIVQSDEEVATYCSAAGLKTSSPAFKFFDLRCTKEEAVRRMHARPVRERDDFPFEQQYDGLTGRLRASGATRINTDDATPLNVAKWIVAKANQRGD